MESLLAQYRYVPKTEKTPPLSEPISKRARCDDALMHETRATKWLTECDDTSALVFSTQTDDKKTVRFAAAAIDSAGRVLNNHSATIDEPVQRGRMLHFSSRENTEFIVCLMRRAVEIGTNLVAHDAQRHLTTLKAIGEKHRVDMSLVPTAAQVVCTMRGSRLYYGIASKNGKSNLSTATELNRFLLQPLQSELAGADAEVSATAQSFVEGRVRGWW